jgi:hypothetical protein
MVQMLRDADSSGKHLSTARRHMRLCKTVKGAEFLAVAIEPHYTRLEGTGVDEKKAIEAEEDAQDDRDLRGREGADALRTASERAKQHDRDTPGDNVFSRLFPEGGFSDFIASNGTTSGASCRLIATRARDLGANHALSSLGTELEARATAIDAAQMTLDNAVRAKKLAEAEDELAQAALRRAYEENWLDAQKKFGKAGAERLFPRIRKRESSSGDDPAGT